MALLVPVAACSGKIALRYHPPAGAVYHYVLTMRNSDDPGPGMPQAPPHDRVWTIQFTAFVRFTDRRGGGTEVGAKVDGARVQSTDVAAEDRAPDVSLLIGRTATAFLDGRGRLMRTEPPEFPGLSADMAYRMRVIAAAGAISFPEERVRVGDSWTITSSPALQAFGGQAEGLGAMRATVTLKAIHVTDADTVVVLGIDEQLPTQPVQVTTVVGNVTVHPSGSVTGEYQFSLARGTMISETLKGTMRMNAVAPALGSDTLLLTSVTETSLHLQ